MPEHNVVHQCIWNLDTWDQRSQITLVVISSELQLYVFFIQLNSQVKSRAVSWSPPAGEFDQQGKEAASKMSCITGLAGNMRWFIFHDGGKIWPEDYHCLNLDIHCDFSRFLTWLLSHTTHFRVWSIFWLHRASFVVQCTGGARDDYPLLNGWMSDMSDNLVGWLRLSHSWSRATSRFTNVRVFFLTAPAGRGKQKMPWQHTTAWQGERKELHSNQSIANVSYHVNNSS